MTAMPCRRPLPLPALTRRRPRALAPALAALAVATLAWPAGGTRAQTEVTALTGQTCPGTRWARDLGCTSNDFTTTATFTQPAPGLPSCVAGTSLSLDVIADVTSHAPDRYDGAVFLGERGNDPTLNDAAQTCSLAPFPTAPSPFTSLDGDPVGDFVGNSAAQLVIRKVTVYCAPAPGTNVLGLPYVLVFDQNASTDTVAGVRGGSTSKCVATTAAQVTGVIVQGWIRITTFTNPAGDPQAFPWTTSGTAAASPATFSTTSGTTQLVQIPLGATGGSQTIQLDEAALPGWNPSATITCTTPTGAAAPYVTVDGANRRITAVLDATNFGAQCTITNEKYARITVAEASAGATGPFAYTSGTNGLPAAFALDTTAANPATLTWPVASNGAAVSVTQAPLPAGWTLGAVSCSDGAGAVGAITGGTVSLAAAEVTPGRNITCTFAHTRKATLTKAFGPTSAGTGKPASLVFTVTNRPGSPAQAGLGWTDTLPAGLAVASPLAVSSTCGGIVLRAGTATPLAAGDTALTFSGGALASGTASCTVTVAVASATAGTYTNGAAQVTGVVGGVESAVTSQTLTVYLLPSVLMVKSADRATAKPGDVVTYTLVVQNGGPGVATSLVLSEPLSPLVAWGVDGFGPGVAFQLTDGAPASGVTLGAPAYSSDGGATWTLVPASGGGGAAPGFDGRVTNWRLPLTGTLAAGRELTLTFRVAVK
jgi:uncharacterized repeat protein (TIGR01451 family)